MNFSRTILSAVCAISFILPAICFARPVETAEEGANILPVPDKSYVPDIQLKELSGKMETAVDPKGVFRNGNGYFIKRNILINGKFFNIEATYKKPDKSKTVTYLDGKIIQKTVSNGEKCWATDRNNSKSEIAGLDFERQKNSDEMANTSFRDFFDLFDRVEFCGEEKVYESQCYILFCYPKVKDLEPIVLSVSKSDYLIRKIITLRNGKPSVYVIKKYDLSKGVMIASETERDINKDGKMELMTVTDHKIFRDVPDSVFEQ